MSYGYRGGGRLSSGWLLECKRGWSSSQLKKGEVVQQGQACDFVFLQIELEDVAWGHGLKGGEGGECGLW